MATTITPAVLQALQTSVSKIFQGTFQDTPTFYQQIATTVQSSTSLNTYAWLAGVPKMREWLGPRVVHGLENISYQIVNKKYEHTLGVGRDELADDMLGLFAAKTQDQARVVKKLPDDLVLAQLLAGGTNLSFDGVPFFSASHPALDGVGTQSNVATSTALNAANFDAQRTAMRRIRGYDGDEMGILPNLLIVAPEQELTARTILTAAYGASGATNVQVGQAGILVIDRLPAGTWYLADTSMSVKPFIFQNRESPEFVAKFDPSDDNVFLNDQYLWGVRARAGAGYGPWWTIRRMTP